MIDAGPPAIEPDDEGPEAGLRRILDLAMAGDGAAFLDLITSEAYVDLLHILPNMEETNQLTHYEVEPVESEDRSHRFRVKLLGGDVEITPTITVSIVKGTWRLSAIKMAGIRD